MTRKEGTLHLQPSGRWAICRPGREPVITSGDVFRVEVDGELRSTRMEAARVGCIEAVGEARRHARGDRQWGVTARAIMAAIAQH